MLDIVRKYTSNNKIDALNTLIIRLGPFSVESVKCLYLSVVFLPFSLLNCI